MTKDYHQTENHQYSEAYLLEKEKIKTRRTRNRYIFFGVIILAAIFGLYFIIGKGGKGGFNVDITKGTFSFNVDKPVVEQAKTTTKTYESPDGKTINYTTGTISRQILDDFSNKDVSFSPYFFVGDNLVNSDAGYILSSSHPDLWNVQYNPAGLDDPLVSIHSLTAPDGSNLNVGRIELIYTNVADFVESSVNYMMESGMLSAYPYISYSDDRKTAFLTFTNYLNNGQSYMKVVEGKQYFYTVTANYNLDLTDFDLQDELIWMVANFTLIE